MGRFFYSGRQFLFSFKIEKRIFNNVLVNESEIFVNFFFSTSVFSEIRTKFMPLLRTDFSESESEKFPGMGDFRRLVRASNLRTNKLVEFFSLYLVQMVKKFKIGILNFGGNRLY